jgi:hypothetical protein
MESSYLLTLSATDSAMETGIVLIYDIVSGETPGTKKEFNRLASGDAWNPSFSCPL